MSPVYNIALVLAWPAALLAQSATQGPVFEAASIKPAAPNSNGSTFNTSPGRLTATNWNLRQYVMIAYDMKTASDIIGGPKWADFDAYDIEAKMEDAEPASDRKKTDPRIRAAFQALLADRFHLVIHREPRSVTGYALEAAKKGPKLKQAQPGKQNSNKWSYTKLTSTSVSMDKFAEVLSRTIGSPVTDRTGIRGLFDITLEWTPDSPRESSSTTPSGPNIFAALQEQLGLKLEPQKVTHEVIVIDHAEKPEGN